MGLQVLVRIFQDCSLLKNPVPRSRIDAGLPGKYLKEERLNFKILVSSGGMPSSHSAMVTSLTTAIGLQEGWTSSLFCVSCVFTLVVLYDAAGVRRAAGKQARILNQIVDDLFKGEYRPGKLTELLGHTPLEVIVGFFLGIGIAFSLYY